MKKVIIRYIDDREREDVFGVHPVDLIRSKRELANKSGVDDEYRAFYLAFLASARSGVATGQFDAWLANVDTVEILTPPKEITDLEDSGAFGETPGVADVLRAKWARYEDAEGEAEAPLA